MRKAASVIAAIIQAVLISSLVGCGSSNGGTTDFPTPASISLTPGPDASVEIGKTIAFTGTPKNAGGTTINTPLTYLSSNTAVLTIATVIVNGVATPLACGGSWDSLTIPQICTPGPSGVAQVTATAKGVSSPVTTVHVHQHIDSIEITTVPDQIFPATYNKSDPNACVSASQLPTNQLTLKYHATARSSGMDITPTVGPFTWQLTDTTVATLATSTALPGLPMDQVQITAKVPGQSTLFATLGDTSSAPLNFMTCPVQSIELTLSPPPTQHTAPPTPVAPFNNPVLVPVSGTATIYARVLDAVGLPLTNAPLTWTSSTPAVLTAATATTTFGGQATATATAVPGGTSVIASCAPPTCNIGLPMTSVVFPQKTASFIVTGTSTTTRPSTTIYAGSTACGTADNCISTLQPIAPPTTTDALTYTVGTPIALPATPNSMLFDRQGTNTLLGTNNGFSGTRGLMLLSGGAVNQFVSTIGKVLAISPDGKKAIIADTINTPNLVYVFDTTGKTSVALNITGATAADFSADSLRAFIVADTTVYVYSTRGALQTFNVATGTGPRDVSFLTLGKLGYLAGGTNPGVTEWAINQNFTPATVPTAITTTPATPDFIRGLPDSCRLVALHPPFIDLIDVDVANRPVGCTSSAPSVVTFDLGQGNFTARQLLMSSDGTRAYILGSTSNIIVFNIGTPSASSTTSSIALAANVSPLAAALDTSGAFLYVGASDGTVHVIDTRFGTDITQVTFTKSFCQDTVGNPANVPSCNPDLIAVKP